MKRVLIFSALFVLAAASAWTSVHRSRMKHPYSGQEVTVPGTDGEGVLLPDGWKVTPAGRQLTSGDMILSAAVSPDGKLLAFTNTGYTTHKFHVVNLATEKEIATFPLERAWSGLVWTSDSKRVLISAGEDNPAGDIYSFERWNDEAWTESRPILFRTRNTERPVRGESRLTSTVSSIAISPDGKFIYAINDGDGNLEVLDGLRGRSVTKLQLGDHPFTAKLAADGNRLYVSLLGEAAVVEVDVHNPQAPTIARRIEVEPHPNDLAITKDDRMFVSCGNTNHVVAIDLKTNTKMEAVNVAPTAKAPAGSTPNSIALSPDNKRLFVANADNNSVAVIDIGQRGESRVSGFIPTGWYPTVVMVTPDGKRVLIGSGKGLGTGPNHLTRTDDGSPYSPVKFAHHGNNLTGLLSFVDMPTASKLAAYTKQVLENSPYKDEQLVKAEIKGNSVIPSEVGKGSPIKHILYIIKENRTYDQVFGDIKKGNGDPGLVMFGREVTPNHHAIAEQFVLLDNLYCNGEVSQDGHPWSTSAYATDMTQRAWTLGYSRHGSVGGRSTEEQTHPYIWEEVMEKGLTAFSFGYGGRRGTAGIMSKTFGKNDLPDQQSAMRDYHRADQFVREYQQMDAENRVPNFMIMGLGEDHTSGTAPGRPTPQAAVASNDVAIGKIVEAVSKSKAWSSSAIFIIEDDAQNGPDHVDSHRTVGLVISPYIKRGTVDSTMYTTVSMLRTMELLLGLSPMTQHDAAATPMYNSFSNTPDLSTYTALPPSIDLTTKNTTESYGAAFSAKLDFSDYDRADWGVLNDVLWHSIKGANTPMPAPVRRGFFVASGTTMPLADDDDDAPQGQ